MTSNSELKISLAAWSLHREFFDKKIDQLGMLDACAEFGITGFELVNTFFPSPQYAYLRHIKKRAGELGVELLPIMCDAQGELAHAAQQTPKVRARAQPRVMIPPSVLGCHSIRVNIRGEEDDPDAMRERAAEGLRMVLDYASGTGISVLLENHGGLSSDPVWLTSLVDLVADPQLGTLPDFGNFPDEVVRYQAGETLMPQENAVSAKCYLFDSAVHETKIDFPRMMKIVKAAGYSGYVGIEYEGRDMPERDGIRACKTLLERRI